MVGACVCCGSLVDLTIDHIGGNGNGEGGDLFHLRLIRQGFPTGVRLWIGPGGSLSWCPRDPVTLRGCSCGAGRVFALADPLRSVRSACGVRAGVRGAPGTGLAGRGRGVPGMPGLRRGGCRAGQARGQAAGGAFGCCDPGVAGRGSRCSWVAAGTTSLLLRALTFLMVKRG